MIDAAPTDERQAAWSAMHRQIVGLKDARGKGMDPQIVDLVTALNLFGYATEGSCQGHLNRALASPWVQLVGPDEEPEGAARFWAAHEELDRLRSEAPSPALDAQAEELLARCAALEPGRFLPEAAAAARERWARLEALVADYERRRVQAPRLRLILRVAPALNARLGLAGENTAADLGELERRAYLREAQTVMLGFARFLYERFLTGES